MAGLVSAWKRLKAMLNEFCDRLPFCDHHPEKREVSELMEWNLAEDRAEIAEIYFGSPPDGKVDKELWRKHCQQIDDSEGFDIKDFPICNMPAFVQHSQFGVDSRPYELAEIALEKYNFVHNKQYEFVRVITVNARLAAGSIYYITFEARKTVRADPTIDPLVTFQARVWDRITPRVPEVQLCRIKYDYGFYLLGIHLSWWRLMITLLIVIISIMLVSFW